MCVRPFFQVRRKERGAERILNDLYDRKHRQKANSRCPISDLSSSPTRTFINTGDPPTSASSSTRTHHQPLSVVQSFSFLYICLFCLILIPFYHKPFYFWRSHIFFPVHALVFFFFFLSISPSFVEPSESGRHTHIRFPVAGFFPAVREWDNWTTG